MEKNKSHLLDERDKLSMDLKDMTTSFQESDKRRKNAEAALSEAQSRIGEDTSRIQELTSQNEKQKVNGCGSGCGLDSSLSLSLSRVS